jgi:hypothetical protein
MGPHALSQALKAPFEKLGSVARKQRAETTPYPVANATDEESLDVSHRHHRLLTSGKREWRTPDDDRQREFHLRKLFLKGPRSIHRDNRRPDIGGRLTTGGLNGHEHNREFELRALQIALARETAFRERQAERDRQTVMEDEARKRMRVLEDEIYTERTL